MKIAIIGMGVACISVLREWTKEKEINLSVELTVFGDERSLEPVCHIKKIMKIYL